MTDILGDRGRAALISILYEAIVRIRHCGWCNLANQCAEEADHIHNIPGILLNPSVGQLKCYLKVEAVAFRRVAGDTVFVFEPHWSVLEELLQELLSNSHDIESP
jgi:hypothetical protein